MKVYENVRLIDTNDDALVGFTEIETIGTLTVDDEKGVSAKFVSGSAEIEMNDLTAYAEEDVTVTVRNAERFITFGLPDQSK